MRIRPANRAIWAALGAVLAATLLLAGAPAIARGGDHSDPGHAPEGEAPLSIATSLPAPFSDAGGLREALAARGFEFGLKYLGEVFSNARGGLRRGTIYEGKLRFSLDVDLDKAAGLAGLTFHANASQLHGRGIDAHYVGALMPVSNIEATPATRLFELWLQQSLYDDKISLRLGQLGADQEFMTRSWGKIFINNSFGWPAITISDLPSGGPAFPLSALGARVTLNPTKNLSLLAAVFDGDPAGPQGPFDDPDPQVRNRDGLRFRLRDPPFVIGEAQAKYSLDGLAGAAKFGGWRHFGRFADQRLGADFLSLADPNSSGAPLRRRGDFGVYALVDQQIARVDGDPSKGAGVFLRASVSPNDRNLVSVYADAGVSFTGVLPTRPNDLFGAAVGYARISSSARAFDRDSSAVNGAPAPVRSAETLFEATYIAQIVPGWTLQPDFQYVLNPGGGVRDPRDLSGVAPLRRAVVIGLRTLIRY